MSDPKPLASLSSGLLARKGQARPAMRPQGFATGYVPPAAAIADDLGWNDMGHATQSVVEAPDRCVFVPAPLPEVLTRRAQLSEELAAPVEPASEPVCEPAPVVALAAPRPVSPNAAARIVARARQKVKPGAKAAFTLRLDGDRHLRLRLASAVRGLSAQQLVTEALDAFLETLPEVEDLARQLPARAKR